MNHKPWWIRWTVWLVGAYLGLAALSVVLAATLGDQVVYLANRKGDFTSYQRSAFDVAPVTLTTSDQIDLKCWYLTLPDPKATILLLHGQGGNVTGRLPKMEHLAKRGYAVFAVDYRGFGQSEGRASEAGLYADADAAYQYLTGEGIAPDKLIILGESLGSAPAIHLASEQEAAALILQSPFASAQAMARHVAPVLPVGAGLRVKLDNVATMAQVDEPLLCIATPEDTRVPIAQSRAVFAAAPGCREFAEFVKCEHGTLYWVHTRDYLDRVDRFLASVMS